MIQWPIEILDNKYKRWYEQIVLKAKEKDLPVTRRGAKGLTCYTEVHHIIPKCFGGSNDKSNLIRFSAREHFICHWLLTKMTLGENKAKMITAVIMMTGEGSKSGKYKFKITNSKTFEKLRIEYSEYIREKLTGREVSKETRKKLSIANTGKSPSVETRAKMSARLKGKPGAVHTPEGLARIAEASRNRVCTEETRNKHSQNNTGAGNPFYGKTHNQDSLVKIRAYHNKPEVKIAKSERVKGDKNPAKRPEVKEKISQQQKIRLAKQKELGIGNYDPALLEKRKELSSGANNGNAKTYEFVDPLGAKYVVTGGFKKFCIEHKLVHGSMLRVAKGTKANYNDWTVKEVVK